MNALEKLLQLDEVDKIKLGVQHTAKEIAQQPEAWRQTYHTIMQQYDAIQRYIAQALGSTQAAAVHLIGAGTSHFVGESVRNLLAGSWRVAVSPVASTEMVLTPKTLLDPRARLMISFARSGQSPEGNAVLQMVHHLRPDIYQLAVTCNRNGDLAKLVTDLGPQGHALVLPDMTNDQGLAMTSSYSSMVVAAQALANHQELPAFGQVMEQQTTAAEHVLATYADAASEIAAAGFQRAVFIGNRDLFGVALESHLKMQEMTAGRILCKAESTLGLRHGPLAALDENTLVVMFVSSDPYVRRYELDLLRGLAAQGLGRMRVVIADKSDAELDSYAHLVVALTPNAPNLHDLYKAPVAVLFPQMLALFRSLEEGLAPDTPSPGGVIHRVVKGVNIYPYKS